MQITLMSPYGCSLTAFLYGQEAGISARTEEKQEALFERRKRKLLPPGNMVIKG